MKFRILIIVFAIRFVLTTPFAMGQPASVCGNGIQESGEQCDDGNVLDDDCCDAICHSNNAGTCSDGNACTVDACQSGSCVSNPVICNALDACHDVGLCDPGTGLCSNPTKNNGSLCDDHDNCTPIDECIDGVCVGNGTGCGDGIINCGEECDDGNQIGGDCCSATCTFEAVGSSCNDRNLCSAIDTCNGAGLCHGSGSLCGNGIIETRCGEECDDANRISGDGCSSFCQIEFCGDGSVNDSGTEVCDDGNVEDDDGCDSNCTPTACGNGIVTSGEECDEGANNSDTVPDACRLECTIPICGDHIADIIHGEECDDGETLDGDGCDRFCLNETDDPRGTLGGDRGSDGGHGRELPSNIGGCGLARTISF